MAPHRSRPEDPVPREQPATDSQRTSVLNSVDVIDLVSSEDENEGPSFVSIVTGNKRGRDDGGTRSTDQKPKKVECTQASSVGGTSNPAGYKEDSGQDSIHPEDSRHASCMPFLHSDDGDNAIVTDAITPLLHKWALPTTGIARATLSCSAILHIQQKDKWSCGFRNLQMLFSALLPHVPTHHACYQRVFDSLRPYPLQENRPIPIPSLHQLQLFLEEAWKDGFDARGAQHYRHSIVGKHSQIGAVEVSSLLSFLQLDSAVLQFIKCSESRAYLGPFVWSYFRRKQCACREETSCAAWAEQLLATAAGSTEDYVTDPTCPCPVLPLYLQWKGHSVTIVGVEKMANDEMHFLLLDPMTDGSKLKQALSSPSSDKMPARLSSSNKLLKMDCQIVMCSPRALTELERSTSRDNRTNTVTAAKDAVLRFLQRNSS